MGILSKKAPRNSNMELLRIISMLAIVAHHSVVNDMLFSKLDFFRPDANVYFLTVWGMWGKTAINSFILISGYFLCKGTFTWQRYAKLLIEIYFYKIVIMAIFMLSGYQEFSLMSIVVSLTGPLRTVNNGFVASFLAFYMFVPIYNKLINSLTERQLRLLLCGLLFYLTIVSTFFKGKTMYEPLWYATLYLIAAYVRMYPNKWTESRKLSWTILSLSVALTVCYAITVLYVIGHPTFLPVPSGIIEKMQSDVYDAVYWPVSDSNKLLALIVGLSAFLVAKNTKPFYNKFINTMSAGTFSVLLIHTSNGSMRHWLWIDVLDMPSLVVAPFAETVFVSMAIPIAIFFFCSSIDYFRRKCIERPMMDRLQKL